MIKECPMRHKNGNCLPIGGFCQSVNEGICGGLMQAYECGRRTAIVQHMIRNATDSTTITMGGDGKSHRIPDELWDVIDRLVMDYKSAIKAHADCPVFFALSSVMMDYGHTAYYRKWLDDLDNGRKDNA